MKTKNENENENELHIPRRDLRESAFRKYEIIIARAVNDLREGQSFFHNTGEMKSDTFISRFNDAKRGFTLYNYPSKFIKPKENLSKIRASITFSNCVEVHKMVSYSQSQEVFASTSTSTSTSTSNQVEISSMKKCTLNEDINYIQAFISLVYDNKLGNFLLSSYVFILIKRIPGDEILFEELQNQINEMDYLDIVTPEQSLAGSYLLKLPEDTYMLRVI